MHDYNNRTFNSRHFEPLDSIESQEAQQLEAANSLSALDTHWQIISHFLSEDDGECASFTPLDCNGFKQHLSLEDLNIDLN